MASSPSTIDLRPRSIPRLRVPLLASYSTLIARLGDAFRTQGDIIQLSGVPFHVFCFRHPDHIRQIYTHKLIGASKHPGILPRVRWIMRQGSFIHTGGDDWKRRRHMLQPIFARNPSLSFVRVVPDAVEAMLRRWRTHADTGQPLDIHREFGCLVVDITFKALFSEDLGERLCPVYDRTHFLLQTFGDRLPPWLPTPRNFRFRREARQLQTLMREIIDRRIAQPRSASDVLSYLLENPDKEMRRKWTVEEIQDEMFSIYFGASIMRVGLTWVMHLLSAHPAIRRKLEEEARTVLGDSPPGAEHLDRLVYTDRVFQEAMRVYPPVWGFPRYSPESVEIADFTFPARSLLLPIGYYAHRHPDFWEEPEVFDPERFAPERASKIHPFAHYPFGGGPRMCLGRNLAPLIMQLAIAGIARTYSLRSAPRFAGDPVAEFGFELGPRDKVLMTIHRI